MCLLIVLMYGVIKRPIKICLIFTPKEQILSKVIHISDLKGIKPSEVSFPALFEIFLGIAALGKVEITVFLWFVLTVFSFAISSTLLVGLGAVALCLEVTPVAIFDILFTKFSLHIFIIEVLIV